MLPTRFPTRRADDAGPEPLLPAASRAVLYEFVATTVFVFAAEGSVYGLWKMYMDTETLGGLLVVAVAHALVLTAAVALASNASGGHVNPAVTFGVLVGRRISFARTLLYWAAQLLGAVLAAALLRLISGGVNPPKLKQQTISSSSLKSSKKSPLPGASVQLHSPPLFSTQRPTRRAPFPSSLP